MCACYNLLKLWRAVLAGVARWKGRGTPCFNPLERSEAEPPRLSSPNRGAVTPTTR